MSYALVVGGSPSPISGQILIELADISEYIVAVDKGMDICLKAGVYPDLFCGDGDSISNHSLSYLDEHQDIERVLYDPHKDDTDLSLAMSQVVDRGYTQIIATSLLGGRIDHQLAVVGVLKSLDTKDIWWVEDTMVSRFLSDCGVSHWNLNESCQDKTFSCISLRDGTVVSESGTRWEVNRIQLDSLSDRGISNVVESTSGSVCVHSGQALICINEAPLSLLNE